MQTVIHWFRNDLRVSDNTALSRAARVAARVVPVFILDEEITGSTGAGPASRMFLLRSVISLKRNLETLGYGLVLRRGKPEEELRRVCRETGATAVFCNKEYEPEARRRDQRVFNALNEAGIGFESFKDGVMWEEEFLTKDLMIHWQWGERWFMRQLVDGDQAANNGGWQWSAGTGTDAAPYFRIFNPVSQGERFDREGEFVRRWVPELASAAKELVHRPWEETGLLRSCGYAERIVIHEEQRARCLAMFRAVKG